jgi:hypothetical protein
MRIEFTLWASVAVYFAVIGVVYLVIGGDPAGVVILLMATGFGGLVAGWTWDWSRKHRPRIEDRADADAADLTGVVGIYPTASLRPVSLAVGVTAMVLGVAIGSWMSMIGLALTASQILLLVRDTDT